MSSPAFHGESQGHGESRSGEVAIIVPVDVVKKHAGSRELAVMYICPCG